MFRMSQDNYLLNNLSDHPSQVQSVTEDDDGAWMEMELTPEQIRLNAANNELLRSTSPVNESSSEMK